MKDGLRDIITQMLLFMKFVVLWVNQTGLFKDNYVSH